MTPTSPPLSTLRLHRPAELLAGIPSLLGFPPVDSLVLMTFTVAQELSLGVTMRADLPPPWDEPDLVDQLCCAVVNNGPVAVVMVVVGGARDDQDALPHRQLVETLADVLHDEGVPVAHALWAASVEQGAPWRCYVHDFCHGQIPDPAFSPLAAAAVAGGRRTYSDRTELAAQLAPDPAEALARREHLLANHPPPTDDEALDRELSFVHQTIEAAGDLTTHLADLDDERIARLGAALSDGRVRDECLALALTDRADAAERLWLALTKALPPPERAEPACLLAVAAYLRGEGALTNVALEVAMEADPVHGLSAILQQALDLGTSPGVLRKLLTQSITEGLTPREPHKTSPPADSAERTDQRSRPG
jgi:hypothetical protein